MIKYTFLGDGSSDKALMKIIDWAFSENFPETTVTAQFAEFTFVRDKIKSLDERVRKAVELYPCDIVFIHRDAEEVKKNEQIFKKRKTEINEAIKGIACYHVAVIPVKMMETWLLTDLEAIRKAAGNRNSDITISLPSLSKLEIENNPKGILHEALRKASCLKGRQLDSFNVHQAVHRVAEYTADFKQLRSLYSFNRFEVELNNVVSTLNSI
jgi:hypothetical protein